MKPLLYLSALAVLLIFAPGPCFALWGIAEVSRERAKELGIEVRAQPAGPNDVRVEMAFKAKGELKGFSRVDLRVGEGDKEVVAPLREERCEERVVVRFSADRSRLDKTNLWIMVPGELGGTVYAVRVKDFVELPKGR